jgi:hypothetical protein
MTADETSWTALNGLLTTLVTTITTLTNFVAGREQTITAAAESLQASAEANQAAAEALEAKAEVKPKTKAKEPEVYAGEPDKAIAFIQEIAFYFRSVKEKELLQMVMVTLSYVKGGTNNIATTWANSQRQLIMNQEEGAKDEEGRDLVGPYATYKQFSKAFLDHFQWGDVQGDSIEILRTLVMGTKTCEEFTTIFRTHEVRSKLGEVALMEEYKRGLNQSLRAKVFNLEVMPTTLKGWQDKATLLDRQHLQEKHYRDLYSPTPSKPKVAAAPSKPAFTPFVPQPAFVPTPVVATPAMPRRDPNAMDVDRAQLMANGQCFYCKEKGHTKFDCPALKNKKTYTTRTLDIASMSTEERSVLRRQLQDFPEDQQA